MVKKIKNMKSATKIKILLVAMLALLMGFLFMIFHTPEDQEFTVSRTITIKDGVADVKEFEAGFTANPEKEGKYTIRSTWDDEEYGFISALEFKDVNGNTFFDFTGGWCDVTSEEVKIPAGQCTIIFKVLSNEDEFATYCKEHFGDYTVEDSDEFAFKDGTYEMNYRIEVKESTQKAFVLGILFGVGFGMLLVALIVVISTYNKKPGPKYDERQIAVQGKAYKYAFFTMLILCGIGLVLDAVDAIPFLSEGVYTFICVMISLCVAATIMILQDAYFQLNENRKFITIMIIILAILNLLMGMGAFASGRAYVDGVFRFEGATNLIVAAAMFYIIIVLVIKTIRDKKED